MTKFTKIALLILGLALAVPGFGQTSLTQTTLASAQGAGPAGLASGDTTALTFQVNLASATGVNQAINGQPITYLYVGNEVEAILTLVVGQTTIFNVLRGQMGTKEAPHPSGDMVLLQTVTPQFGGGSGSGGLQATDPPYNGKCVAANTVFTPWINVNTGYQWICSTITGTWAPGFNNPFAADVAKASAAVASAATITPSGPLFHITGAVAITTIAIPVGFNATAAGGGSFCAIPDNATVNGFTAGNDIAKSSTFVVNQLICMTWDPVNSKFVASY